MMKNPTVRASFRAAAAGILQATAEGRNLRFHWLAGYTVLFLGFWLPLPPTELLILFLVVAQVLAAEMVNTAVETLADLAVDGIHPLVKKAKDIAAGAVLVTAAAAIGVALYLFVPRLGEIGDLLGTRLAHPDAGTVLGSLGFIVLLAYWLVSLPPARAGARLGLREGTGGGAQ